MFSIILMWSSLVYALLQEIYKQKYCCTKPYWSICITLSPLPLPGRSIFVPTLTKTCEQSRRKTTNCSHRNWFVDAAILKIAVFSFIYFRTYSDCEHSTVETSRKAIRNKMFHFHLVYDAAVLRHRNYTETCVLCVNRKLIRYGFCPGTKRIRTVNAEQGLIHNANKCR